MVTSPNRPPSCDLLANENDPNVLASEISARMRRRQKVIHQEPRPKLKECPACANRNQQQNDDFVECKDCGLWGPEDDPHGTKWNSIPRRSEVLELIRLVDECQKTDTQQFHNALFSEVWNYAQKLKNDMEQ